MPRAGKERLAITHRNVPNMVRQITKAIAEEEANIVDMLNKSKGEFAYTLIDIEEKIPSLVIDNIKKVEGILKVRAL
jgi:D-3-phosphoglycerate dehydrogenase